MKFDLKTVLKYGILFLVGIGILYLAFRGQDPAKIWAEIKSANLFWVFVSVLSVWFAHLLRALRWQMLYKSINYPVSFWNAYHAVMVGYLANLALPRFGELARCSVLQRTERVPLFASIGTVITERLFDVLVLLLTAMAMVVLQKAMISDFVYDSLFPGIKHGLNSVAYGWWIGAGCLLILIIFFTILRLRKKFSKRFLRILVSLKQGFGSYYKLRHKALFLLYTLGIWTFYLFSIYFAFLSLPPTAGLHLDAAFTAIVFSGFAMAAPVQGGIGVFHWMVAQCLVLYAVAFKDGLAYATIIHSAQVLLILLLGGLSLLVVMFRRSRP